ncbi:MAG: hypothetical protein ACP5NQ_07310 [Vulcanisaeta sp.]
MANHVVLYIKELEGGNYRPFIEHILNQLPSVLRWSSDDDKILSMFRQDLLRIGDSLVKEYCNEMSTVNIDFFKRSNECEALINDWWKTFVSGPSNNDFWVRQVLTVLELFGNNVGVAPMIVLPDHIGTLALILLGKSGNISTEQLELLSIVIGKLATLSTALFGETLVHLLVEETGTPLSAFMVLAEHAANKIKNAMNIDLKS